MKKLLTGTLLAAAIVANIALDANAATSAQQTLEATLAQQVSVANDPASIDSATIDGVTGALSNQLTPSFDITSNVAGAELSMYATLLTSEGKAYSIADNPSAAGEMIILANQGINAPTPAAVNDIKSGSASAANNPDAIAYPISNTIDNAGTISFDTSTDIDHYAVTVQTGETNLQNTVAQSAVTNTFSSDDHYGTYTSDIYIQIGSHG